MKQFLSLLLAALLAFSHVAPAAAFEGVPSETVVVHSATVASSAVHLSTVATGAFAFIDGVTLPSLVGGQITFVDSSGRRAVGYVMRAGTGEDLAANELVAPDNDFTSGYTPYLSTVTDADTYASTGTGGGVTKNIGLVANALYKTTVNGAISGGVFRLYNGTATALFASGFATTTYTTNTTSPTVYFWNSAAGLTTDITWATSTLQRVTEPPTTGVVISSTSGGTTQSFASLDAGFDPNAVVSYSVAAQGTVAASAVHVATVATGAFAFIDAIDLSPYLGCKLTLRDSSGRTAVGYVMRAGTGENATDLIGGTDPALNNGNFAVDEPAGTAWTRGTGWTVTGGVGVHAGTTSSSISQARGGGSGALLKISATFAPSNLRVYWGSSGNAVLPSITNLYRTQIGSNFAGFGSFTDGDTVDNVTYQQVTEPPVTGVVIASAKGGAVQSWAATTTGFDPNAVTFYSISRVHVAALVHSGSMLAGLGHISTVPGTAFIDPDIGEDWSGFADGLHFLVVQDATGKTIGGYLKEPGGGETSTALVAGDDSTFLSDTGFWIKGANTTIGGGLLLFNGVASSIYRNIATIGRLYYASVKVDSWTSGAALRWWGGGATSYGEIARTAGTTTTKYITADSIVLGLNNFSFAAVGACDDLLFNAVDTPSATGATVVSAKSGTTYNWTWTTTGFDPNGALSFRIYYVGY